MNTTRKQGPFVKKLIIKRMSQLAIPSNGGFSDGIKFLLDPDRIMRTAKEATQWVFAALDVVKTAPDNPYGNDDEAIAKAILDKIEEKNNTCKDRYDQV